MDEWVKLLITNDETEAQIIKTLLEAEDISVVVNSSKIRPYPVSIGRLGEVKLLVKKENLEKAKEILKIMEDTSAEMESNDYRYP